MSQQHRRRWAVGAAFVEGVAQVVPIERARVLRVFVEGARPGELYNIGLGALQMAMLVEGTSLAAMAWLNEVDPPVPLIIEQVVPLGSRRVSVQFESWAEWPL